MSDQCLDTFRCNPQDLRQAMSIHTRKITDSCRDKDCIEDLRVYLSTGSQILLDAAKNVRVRCAKLLDTYIQVEPMAFDRNHYCIDVTFFYRIEADALVEPARCVTLVGLAVFSKRAVLCGEESSAHVYTTDIRHDDAPNPIVCPFGDRPAAVVEVLDPMVLGSKVRDVCECGCQCPEEVHIPQAILDLFDDDITFTGERRRLYVSLGQFSIIRLERDAQLVVPVLDYSIPTKECCDCGGCSENPCELFSKIPFPEDRFAPRGCDGPEKRC